MEWSFVDRVDVIARASRRLLADDLRMRVHVLRDPSTPTKWTAVHEPVDDYDHVALLDEGEDVPDHERDGTAGPGGRNFEWCVGAEDLLLLMVMSDGSEHRCKLQDWQGTLSGATEPETWEGWRSGPGGS